MKITVGNIETGNGVEDADGSSQMSAEFVYQRRKLSASYSESGKYLVQGIAINGLAVTDKVF